MFLKAKENGKIIIDSSTCKCDSILWQSWSNSLTGFCESCKCSDSLPLVIEMQCESWNCNVTVMELQWQLTASHGTALYQLTVSHGTTVIAYCDNVHCDSYETVLGGILLWELWNHVTIWLNHIVQVSCDIFCHSTWWHRPKLPHNQSHQTLTAVWWHNCSLTVPKHVTACYMII